MSEAGVLRKCHPPEINRSLNQARRQHVNNLLAVLDRCLLSGDTALVAAVCSLALAMLDVQRYSQPDMRDTKGADAAQWRITSVFNAVREVLLSSTDKLHPEQVRRHLQQLQSHHPTHGGAELITNCIAQQLLIQGDMDGAQKLLLHPGRGRPSARAPLQPGRQALAAVITYSQWYNLMQPVRAAHQQQASGARGPGDPKAEGFAHSSVFVHDRRVWMMASSNHLVRDAWREAEVQIKEAITCNKHATVLSLLLVHLYVTAGRWKAALAAARAALAANPSDADSATLLGLVQQLAADHAQDSSEVRLDQALLQPLPGGWVSGGVAEGNAPGGPQDGIGAGPGPAGLAPQIQGIQGLSAWLHGEGVHDPDPGHTTLATHLATLDLDPMSGPALDALLERAGGGGDDACCDRCRVAAALGSMTYLDMQGVALGLPLASAAWECLAGCIESLSVRLGRQAVPQDAAVEAHLPGDGTSPGRRDSEHAQGAGRRGMEKEGGKGQAQQAVVPAWRHVRAALQQRAGWWPLTQLQQRSASSPAYPGHSSHTEQPKHMLVVCAHMLGPLHPHTQALAANMRAAWEAHAARSGGVTAGSDAPAMDQQGAEAGPSNRPQQQEQGRRKPERVQECWVDDVLAISTACITAEYELQQDKRAPVMKVDDAHDRPGVGRSAGGGGAAGVAVAGAAAGSGRVQLGGGLALLHQGVDLAFPSLKRRRLSGKS